MKEKYNNLKKILLSSICIIYVVAWIVWMICVLILLMSFKGCVLRTDEDDCNNAHLLTVDNFVTHSEFFWDLLAYIAFLIGIGIMIFACSKDMRNIFNNIEEITAPSI